jgi:hypothetical protein
MPLTSHSVVKLQGFVTGVQHTLSCTCQERRLVPVVLCKVCAERTMEQTVAKTVTKAGAERLAAK